MCFTALFLDEAADDFVFAEENKYLQVVGLAVNPPGANFSLHVLDEFFQVQVITVQTLQIRLFARNQHVVVVHRPIRPST